MFQSLCVSLATTLTFAIASLVLVSQKSLAKSLGSGVSVTCDRQGEVPTVIATLTDREASQIERILSFLPEYFSDREAVNYCQSTAEQLNTYYSERRMNYLASDTIDSKPVVCAVERRGMSCDGYGSEILFSLANPVSPTELLYNMLGDNFKGSKLPSPRAVSRIYTDLRPSWWPFERI